MTYFPDLSPFTYSRSPKCGPLDVLSVGWLDGEHEFTKGSIGIDDRSKLETTLSGQVPIHCTKGEHVCELCRQVSGNGEYHTFNPRTNKIYITPALILHYIQVHQYVPPQEFIEAVFHKLLQEDDCMELESLFDALDFGLKEKITKEKINRILGI